MDTTKLDQHDRAEIEKFLAFLRDRKKLRKATALGLPCPLSPRRVDEIKAYITGQDVKVDDDEGMPD